MSETPRGKGLDRRHAEHLAAQLRDLKRARYDDNGTTMARALGISQSQLSSFLAGAGRGVGISVLIRLRDRLGISIDDLLGLPPLASKAAAPPGLEDVLRKVIGEMAPAGVGTPPSAPRTPSRPRAKP